MVAAQWSSPSLARPWSGLCVGGRVALLVLVVVVVLICRGCAEVHWCSDSYLSVCAACLPVWWGWWWRVFGWSPSCLSSASGCQVERLQDSSAGSHGLRAVRPFTVRHSASDGRTHISIQQPFRSADDRVVTCRCCCMGCAGAARRIRRITSVMLTGGDGNRERGGERRLRSRLGPTDMHSRPHEAAALALSSLSLVLLGS